MRPPQHLSHWCVKFLLFVTLAVSGPKPLHAQDASKLPSPLAVAVDSQGYIYLVGNTLGASMATTPGVFQPTLPPGACTSLCGHGYVAKVSPDGDTVAWAAYLAGADSDSVRTLAIAADGNLYVAGTTTSTTLTGPSGNPSGALRVFVAKVSSDGKSLLAATYFGGSGSDTVTKLALDPAGNVYIAGTTASTDFPTTPGAYQRVLGGTPSSGPCIGPTDQFVAKFDPALKTVLFSTLIGTPEVERTDDFVIGSDGSLYVAGTRGSERECQPRSTLTRLNPQATSAVYSIEVGMGGYAVAVDPTGTAYLANDNRFYGLASPGGLIFKIDPQGRVVTSAALNGLILSLVAGSGDIGVLGRSWPKNLTTTAGAPQPCFPMFDNEMTSIPYVARLNLSTLAPTYLGYLTANQAWMGAVDRVVASAPYSTLLPYGVLPAGPPTDGTVTCIADAADYQSNAAAPGEIVSLFGTGIGPSSPAVAQPDRNGNIAADLAGVRVLANGLPAPLLYVASSQINLVMPFGASGDRVHMELYQGASLVTQFDKFLSPRHPGIFAVGEPLIGQLAALNQDGSVNSSSNPAGPGSIVSIFLTGLGVMTPQLPDGAAPPVPVNTTVVVPQIYVNGQLAELLYIGNAPTLVQGLVQINLRLPNPIPPALGLPTGQVYIGLSYPPLGADEHYAGGAVSVR